MTLPAFQSRSSKDAHGTHCTFRSLGSKGLIVFQRDGTLMRRKRPPGHFMLGDVSSRFVDMLAKLREHELRFGFISSDRGMDAGSRGESEYRALTRLLDQLLTVRGAMPDFWIACSELHRKHEAENRLPRRNRQIPDTGFIGIATEWYGIERQKTVYVGSSATGPAEIGSSGVIHVPYSSFHYDQTFWPAVQGERATAHETVQIEHLYARIRKVFAREDHVRHQQARLP
ncbi:UNVERIFIED_ORG: histidinol phosphatase-like enzyme [Rhizobium sp. SORGH_AS260]|uniref:hypothetical protein n=1 Tax=Agrobacterium sp. SORGH_AS_0440 TaxID=3041757 RepID=UPI00116B3208|nr:hypothetical protein [Agrobacterium sp. SORGH_AS_0440]MDP9734786.1 histidinol phosphatase-like enzyme [Rhizobium sp. SORGH_AS_0285]MDP9757005.1 histidinol phosphatase-like enzyme [Rhizobium sp. SORGH_AS_0260]MDR6083746.1 histidinol phosphatase-like enzyme [Agrobacterium sp. SORGH_AS_0440]